jgi:microcystin-dependent protein
VSQPYIGEIRMVGFNFAPNGWAFCDGSLLSISENTALFELIGTTYGGDGQSTFALPDLSGRIPVHQGSSFVIGQRAGTEFVTLSVDEMPAHSHSLAAWSAEGSQPSPAHGVWAKSLLEQFSTSPPSATMAASLQNSGLDQAHNNMPTFQVVSFIISLFGVFPSQS